MTRSPSNRREAGFSLSEALAVLAILAIALAVSIPALSQFMRSYSARVGFDELTSSLRLARHLAIARHADVSVVVAADTYTLPDWGAPDPVAAPPRTMRLPPGCAVVSGAGTITFRSDGTVSTGATAIRLEVAIDSSVTARGDVSVSTTGKVSSAFTRVTT